MSEFQMVIFTLESWYLIGLILMYVLCKIKYIAIIRNEWKLFFAFGLFGILLLIPIIGFLFSKNYYTHYKKNKI